VGIVDQRSAGDLCAEHRAGGVLTMWRTPSEAGRRVTDTVYQPVGNNLGEAGWSADAAAL